MIMLLTNKPMENLSTTGLWTSRGMKTYHFALKYVQTMKMAVQRLSVPASSAPVERFFSFGGLICSQRTNMGSDLLCACVKAKINRGKKFDATASID